MDTNLIRHRSPEEEELAHKKIELAALESELAERELDFQTFEVELRAFERRYIRSIGVLYAELDDIEAQIAEVEAKLNPRDSSAQTRAKEQRSQAEESAQASSSVPDSKGGEDFHPSQDIKKLYREVAKRIHPDLATDQAERSKRNALMAEANIAYESGNAERLQSILQEWEAGPENIKGDGIGEDLIRTIRKIAQIRRRLQEIEEKIELLKGSELFKLKEKVRSSQQDGRDLLREMSEAIKAQIVDRRITLESRLRQTQATSARAKRLSLVLERVLNGHTSLVNSVCFSSDGLFLVSASTDTSIRLWQTKTGSEIYRFDGHEGIVKPAVLSHDNKFILSAHDLTLRLWNVETRKQVQVFRGHTLSPLSAQISSNNRVAYSGGLDGTIRMWDVSTGREINSIDIGTYADGFAFSSDGKIALVRAVDGDVASMWNLESATEEYRFTNLGHCFSLAISADAHYGIFGSGGGWQLWDLKKRIGIGEHNVNYESGSDNVGDFEDPDPDEDVVVWGLSISPNNRYFVSCTKDEVGLWDLEKSVHLSSVRTNQGEILSSAFSHDSKYVAVGSVEGEICLLRIES